MVQLRAERDPENHPVKVNPQDVTLMERVEWLERIVAMLWDSDWWKSLPNEIREEYEKQGFSSPISKYYGVPDIVESKRGC